MMVFLVIGLALLLEMLFPSSLVSLQLLGVTGMVQIFPSDALIAGIVTVAFVHITNLNFGIYEEFLGLFVNVVVIFVLNPIFANVHLKKKIL